MSKKVTIVKVRRTASDNINRDLQWIGNSLGLFGLRDKDSSCFRVFITLVKRAKKEDVISSDDIANKLHLSRGTVVHHLTKLMNAGIVIRESRGYILRESNMQALIRDIKRDIDAIFEEVEQVSKEIDDKIG